MMIIKNYYLVLKFIFKSFKNRFDSDHGGLFGRLRQEGWYKFEARLSYIANHSHPQPFGFLHIVFHKGTIQQVCIGQRPTSGIIPQEFWPLRQGLRLGGTGWPVNPMFLPFSDSLGESTSVFFHTWNFYMDFGDQTQFLVLANQASTYCLLQHSDLNLSYRAHLLCYYSFSRTNYHINILL